jgi:integrase
MESIINKRDLNYDVGTFDIDIVNDYLKEVKKRSDGAARNHKQVILKCLNYINKPISTITMIDVKQYFEKILDLKDIKLLSKEAYRSYLKSFFYHIQALLLDKGINFNNPVPIKKVYRFTRHERDIRKISVEREKIFTNSELKYILQKAKQVKFRDFMIFSILTCAGMRVSECLTIKMANINLKERYIETGFVKDARKSNRALIFFIPKRFVPFLEKYIKYVGKNSTWLFKGRSTHYSVNSWYGRVRKLYGDNFARSHSFRKTLITNRIKMGCTQLISEKLANHKSNTVEGEHYVKLSIPDRRKYYDKYFPYKFFPFI